MRRNPENNYGDQGVKILRYGRTSSEISAESPGSREKKPTDGNILRFGRADNKMRFGRADNMMRFGRGNMMRFGRGNMMRFGRAGNVMRFGKRASDNDFERTSRAGNVMRFGRSDKNPMRFGKRDGRIYCEDYNCLVQEKESRIIDNDNDDQLKTLFGVNNNNDDDNAKQSQLHNEYIIT